MPEMQHTEYLWALGALAVPLLLFILYLRWKQKVTRKNKYGPAITALTKNHSPLAFTLRFILFFIALAGVILSLGNLRKPGAGANVSRKGVDVVFALDISKSMLAEDVKPNRLERAKLLINKITEDYPDNRTGLVVFAGAAYMQMPLTFDQAAARMLVNNAATGDAPTGGTAIGQALKLSSNLFSTREKKYKAVILVTDGEDHEENALREAKNLKDSGAILLTVGMGSEEGTNIIDPVTKEFAKDQQGNTIVSKLNAPLLQQLAAATDGKYIHYNETAGAVTAIKEVINGLGTRSIADKSLVNYNTYYQWFLLPALVLLLVELMISETKRIKAKTKINKAVAVAVKQ